MALRADDWDMATLVVTETPVSKKESISLSAAFHSLVVGLPTLPPASHLARSYQVSTCYL